MAKRRTKTTISAGIVVLLGVVVVGVTSEDESTAPDVSRETSAPNVSRETSTPEVTAKPKPPTQRPTYATTAPIEELQEGREAPVVRVVDGDTVRVLLDDEETALRLIGLDTPETVHPRMDVQCYGPEATTEAKRVLEGETVTVITDPTQGDEDGEDNYDRLLAYVEVDGLDFAAHMIEGGWATEYTYRGSAYERQDAYRAAEDLAVASGAGLHSAC